MTATSRDDTARLWSVATGAALAVLSGHSGVVIHAVFSPDGERVLTTSRDNTARLWPVYFREVLELAESLLPITLTHEGRARMLERSQN